jgi:hypothetical protein
MRRPTQLQATAERPGLVGYHIVTVAAGEGQGQGTALRTIWVNNRGTRRAESVVGWWLQGHFGVELWLVPVAQLHQPPTPTVRFPFAQSAAWVSAATWPTLN